MIDKVIIEQLDGLRSLYEWKSLEFAVAMKEGTGADTGGVNPLPHGKMLWTPATVTQPAVFKFTGAVRKPGQTWDDCYIYGELNNQPLKAVYFEFEFQIAFPPATLAARRPFEIELDFCELGLVYNMAWQLKFNSDDGGPGYRVFNMKTGNWEFVPGLPILNPAPQTTELMSAGFKAYFLIDRAARTVTHDSLVIGGVHYIVNVTHSAVQKWSPKTNHFNHAVQWDSDGKGTPLTALIQNWHVRCI